jgi:hypothetical protein
MCPLCISAATLYLAGASSVGGTVALILTGSGIRKKIEHDDTKYLDRVDDERAARREDPNIAPE